MSETEAMRRIPSAFAVRIYPLDDGFKVEVESHARMGYGPTLYEGAFASLEACVITAVLKLREFGEEVSGQLSGEKK